MNLPTQKELEASRFFKSFYPRKYACPGGWMSPKAVACMGVTTMNLARALGVDGLQNNGVLRDCYVAFAQFSKMSAPTYWVERDLSEALSKTKPPATTPLSEIKWPMKSILFLLGEGEVLDVDGNRCDWILVGNMEAMRDNQFSFEHPNFGYHADMMLAITGTMDGIRPMYSAHIPMSKTLECCEDIKGTSFERKGENGELIFNSPNPLPESEDEFLKRLVWRAVNLLMFMSAKPEDVTGEQVLGKGKKRGISKSHPHPPEDERLWAPRFLGREYGERYRRSLGGTHASPSAHWRVGFWRRQHYGTGNLMVKDIWIEPVLVNA
jgi:hypothetical protein